MAARSKKTDKKATPKADVTKPRFAYVGPPGKLIKVPALGVSFNPSGLDDAKIERILKNHPALIRYFTDAQEAAAEEE